jgi:ribonucleoside-diphosphate reductase subunit M2
MEPVSKAVKETESTESKLALLAPTVKAEEADEPLLQVNPQRFVLFPIKYHEVRVTTSTRRVRVKW